MKVEFPDLCPLPDLERVWTTSVERLANEAIIDGDVILAVTATNHPPEPFIYCIGVVKKEPKTCGVVICDNMQRPDDRYYACGREMPCSVHGDES